MHNHDYKPGDPIEVGIGTRWIHEGRTYVGEWRGQIVYDVPGVFQPEHAPPEYVRPYTPPIEIPEGWTLIRSDELEVGVHEVYDPNMPDDPWAAIDEIINGYPMLVVARESDA